MPRAAEEKKQDIKETKEEEECVKDKKKYIYKRC